MTSPLRTARQRKSATAALLSLTLLGCAGSTTGDVRAGGAGPKNLPDLPVSYRPYSASYQGVTRGHVEQEVNGQLTANDFLLRYDLTVNIDSAVGSLAATFVIDSVPEISGAGFVASQADQVRGATFSATLAPSGSLVGFHRSRPAAAGPIEELLTRVLEEFFPILPEGGAATGMTWEDTVETRATLGGADITRISVRRHEVTGWTGQPETRALRIVTRSTYELTGSGEQFGREFTLSGDGHRLIEQFLGEDGRYRARVITDTSRATVEVDVGLTIPIHQTRVDSMAIRG